MKQFLFLFGIAGLLTSCATKKQIIYFQDAEALNSVENQQIFEPIIEVNDILHISVSSMNDEVVLPFKRNMATDGVMNNSNPGLHGYLVNIDGNILFPVIGEIPVAGKTRSEVVADLKKELLEFVVDVVVDVRIMNFKVTVIGEVNNPGVYTITDERVTLPQAIGLAGDLTKDGKRSEILIIRETNGNQNVQRIDLSETSFFNSPFYYLKQNDVVYVEPSLKGVRKSGFIPDVPALLSLVTVVLTSVILITR